MELSDFSFMNALFKYLDNVVIWKFLCQCNIIEVCNLALLSLPSERKGLVTYIYQIYIYVLECNYWSVCHFMTKDVGVAHR